MGADMYVSNIERNNKIPRIYARLVQARLFDLI